MKTLLFCLPLLLLLSLVRWSAAMAAEQPMLAYVQKGELWIRALPAGQPQRLTAQVEAREPRWSPDGQWLSYRSHGQLWAVRVSANVELRVNSGGEVVSYAWSPTSNALSYSSANELTEVAPVRYGNSTHWGSSLSLPFGSGAVWSPDGQSIAFVETHGRTAGGPSNLPSAQLLRFDQQKGKELLFNPGRPAPYGISVVGWPTERQLVLRLDPDFSSSVAADGTPLQLLAAGGGQPREISGPVLNYPDFVSVSPGGHELALAQGAGRQTWTNKRIVVVSLGSGPNLTLTGPNMAAISPAWSADGRRIAYSAGPDAGRVGGGPAAAAALAQRHIRLMKADGTFDRQITRDPTYRDELPRWSADGTFLVFARLDSAGRASIWRVSSSGGRPVPLVRNLQPAPDAMGYYGHIAWSAWFDFWPGTPIPASGQDHVNASALAGAGGGVVNGGDRHSWLGPTVAATRRPAVQVSDAPACKP